MQLDPMEAYKQEKASSSSADCTEPAGFYDLN
jgi:hypothetical protein